jgi:hypothetical protein
MYPSRQVRLDRALSKSKTFFEDNSGSWNQRNLARKWALLAASRSLAVSAYPRIIECSRVLLIILHRPSVHVGHTFSGESPRA